MSENDYILSIIAKQLKGLASPGELQALQQWLQGDAAHQRQYDDLMQIWKSSGSLLSGPGFDTQSAWAKIEGQLHHPQASVQTRSATPVVYLVKRLAVAIVLLAAISLLTRWWFTRTHWETVTATAGNELVVLPDNSQVHIRKGSTLHYPKQFADNERLVELTGEAFFEVQHRNRQPFRITTTHSAIQVLGTSFLVHTNNETDEVVVVTGQVQVQDKNKKSKVIVPAGQRVVLQQHQFSQQKITDSNFIAWKTGHLDFNIAPLQKVLADVAHFYGVPIALDSAAEPASARLTITVRFDNQPLEQVLEEIRLTTGLSLKKEDGKIIFYQK